MSDLVVFLLARIAEDEQVAREAACDRDGRWASVRTPGGTSKTVDSLGYSIIEAYDVESEPWFTAEHIARHDPARVLRECEAKRRIVAECSGDEPGSMYYLAFPDVVDGLNYRVLRALASAYADHPDYRPEWPAEVEAAR